MKLEDQIAIYDKELFNLAKRMSENFNLTYEAMIGTLEMHKAKLVYNYYLDLEVQEDEQQGDV